MKKLLVLSGGGSYGAFEIAIVSTLIKNGLGSWDVITGVSAGSINACYLSTIDKEKELENIDTFKELWTNIKNSDVYKNEYFLNGLSLYNNDSLQKKLSEIFDGRKTVRPVIISATSLSQSTSKLFNNEDIEKYGFKDLIMCSTSIPLLFPPYPFLDDMFVDGGLTSNILLFEGINYCLTNFPGENIEVDVIICGKKISKDIVTKNNIHFKSYIEKLIGIIQQQVEYFQVLDKINIPDKNVKIKINVYEQKNESSISILEFDKCEELWDQGFDLKNVHLYTL